MPIRDLNINFQTLSVNTSLTELQNRIRTNYLVNNISQKVCYHKNPLLRDGTNRYKRLEAALDPNSILIDEHDTVDLIDFSSKFAGLINYWDANNEINGDWKEFFEKDISITIAAIIKTDLEKIKSDFKLLTEEINGLADAYPGLNTTEINNKFDEIFNFFVQNYSDSIAVLRLIDNWYYRLIDENGLKNEVGKIIKITLSQKLYQLYTYQYEILDERTSLTSTEIEEELSNLYSGFGSLWGFDTNTSYHSSGPLIYKMSANPCGETESLSLTEQESRKIKNAVEGISQLFEEVYATLVQITTKAPAYLNDSLQNYALHESHISLYLTFIQLFKYVQNDLNKLTDKHLNYYYKDVLRIHPKEAVPDKVHLLFETNKNITEQKVAEGTLLNAGKDKEGNTLLYKTDKEIIVNQTQVGSIKTVYVNKKIVKNTISGEEEEPIVNNIYAAPIANSKNGTGETLDKDIPKWYLFGENQKELGINERTMPDANVGFALASPQLLLNEGERTINLQLNVKNGNSIFLGEAPSEDLKNIIQAEIKYNLKLYFTSVKGWEEHSINTVTIDEISQTSIDESDTVIKLNIVLNSEAPPISNYITEIHGTEYNTGWPVLKIVFDPDGIDIKSIIDDPNSFVLDTNGTLTKSGFVLNTKDDVLKNIDIFNDQESYIYNDIVQYQSIIFLKNEKFPNPEIDNEYWEPKTVGTNEDYEDFVENKTYKAGEIVKISTKHYIAIKEVSPEDFNYWVVLDYSSYSYKYFQKLEPVSIDINVEVEGLTELIIQNDLSTLSTAKSFHPFGPKPNTGSNFYIGSYEAFQKNLKELVIDIEWEGLPDENFKEYYKEYGTVYGVNTNPTERYLNIENESFRVDTFILDGREWIALTDSNNSSEKNLFEDFDTSKSYTFKVGSRTITIVEKTESSPLDVTKIISNTSKLTTINRDEKMSQVSKYDVNTHKGFILLKLKRAANGTTAGATNPTADFAFGHQQYASILTKAVMSQKNHLIPNEPYTPTIKSISLSYKSDFKLEFNKNTRFDFEDRVEQVFHIHPFGIEEVHPYLIQANEIGEIRIVPKYTNEGNLYIGLQKFIPNQLLNLLFQQIDGSSNPDLETQPVIWSYLRDNRWVNLETMQILSDTTENLLSTGIIQFNIPADISKKNSILPESMHWLRATIDKNTQTINYGIDIRTQAVTATFVPNDNANEHLRTSLPAETIKKLSVAISGIKSVKQPFSSFEGKVKEEGADYYTRVSERLRHKNRSITIWDYERIVLEEFPSIYKVKCLNHTSLNAANIINELHPGYVLVITIPNLRNKNAVNPFEPKTSLAMLEKIKNYLNGYTSTFVNLQVKNPLYERIKVNCKVGFRLGYDPGYYTNVLDEDIKKFLSPWAYEEGKDIVFGGNIHGSQILNYIEEREYVDFVIDFSIDHVIDSVSNKISNNHQEAIATTSRSILVSSTQHSIIPLQSGEYPCEGEEIFGGINFWIIEADFVVK